MLYQFVNANLEILIQHCTAKVAKRRAPFGMAASVSHGVPLFLRQLVDTLRNEQEAPPQAPIDPDAPSALSEIDRDAALHGADLLRRGYSVDQVVHDYGDVCQAITELAVEQNVSIDANEFRTLNSCLDNAIAAAVTAFGKSRQIHGIEQAEDLHQRLGAFADEQRNLVDIAIQAYAAIKTGNIGPTGATGSLLIHTLGELRVLADRSVAEIRLASASTTLTAH